MIEVILDSDWCPEAWDKQEYFKEVAKSVLNVRRSHHFYYSTDGVYDASDLDSLHSARLPFPATTICVDESGGERSIIFCSKFNTAETAAADEYQGFTPLFSYTVLSQSEKNKRPILVPVIGTIGVQDGSMNMSARSFSFIEEFSRSLSDHDLDDYLRGITYYGAQVLRFLRLLHSSNIETSDVPAPSRLNKKRRSRGREPIKPYKVLKIRHSDGRLSPVNLPTDPKGSTRFHHVRGHFRTVMKGQGENKKPVDTWVVPHVRGNKNKGEVKKDYRL